MLPSREASTDDASVEHRPSATDTLLTGVSAKRSNAVTGHDPDVSFPILREVGDAITR